jgi:thymidylate synthase (FAD)
MSKVTLIYPSIDTPVEQVIATATNLSYSKKPISEILERFEDDDAIAGLFERSIGKGHMSVAEHVSFSFLIEDISLPCGEQILRHRTGKFTKQSYRYQSATLSAVVPPTIKKSSYAFHHYMKSVNESYETYKRLIDVGIPKEDARFVIPTGTKCRLMFTIDGRNLLHFINERSCQFAQWEVRGVAVKMYNHLKKVAPNLAGYVKPPCQDCTCSLKSWSQQNKGGK